MLKKPIKYRTKKYVKHTLLGWNSKNVIYSRKIVEKWVHKHRKRSENPCELWCIGEGLWWSFNALCHGLLCPGSSGSERGQCAVSWSWGWCWSPAQWWLLAKPLVSPQIQQLLRVSSSSIPQVRSAQRPALIQPRLWRNIQDETQC